MQSICGVSSVPLLPQESPVFRFNYFLIKSTLKDNRAIHKNIAAQKLYLKIGFQDTVIRKMGIIGEQYFKGRLVE